MICNGTFPHINYHVKDGGEDGWLDLDEEWGEDGEDYEPPPPPPTGPPSTPPPPPPPPAPQQPYGPSSQQTRPPGYGTPGPSGNGSEKPRLNAGSILGFISIFIIIAGILLPWYFVDISVETSSYNTGGRRNIIRMGGVQGFVFQMPENASGDDSVGDNITREAYNTVPALNLCGTCTFIWIVILVIIEVSVIVRYLMDRSFKRGNRFLWHGLFILIPLLILWALLPAIANSYLAPKISHDESGGSAALLEALRSPLGGEQTFAADSGHITVWWGIDIGMYLVIIGACMAIAAGILDRVLTPKPTSTP